MKVLPTPIDGERYTPKEYEETKAVNLGWIGDHGSIHYMESYKDVWDAMGRKYGHAGLTIICDTFIETKRFLLKKINWSYESEIDELQRLDIGVMPLNLLVVLNKSAVSRLSSISGSVSRPCARLWA